MKNCLIYGKICKWFIFIFLKRTFPAYKLITNMKNVLKKLKGRHYLCFLDFEGTQFSHEMIAYGAVLVTIDKKGYPFLGYNTRNL